MTPAPSGHHCSLLHLTTYDLLLARQDYVSVKMKMHEVLHLCSPTWKTNPKDKTKAKEESLEILPKITIRATTTKEKTQDTQGTTTNWQTKREGTLTFMQTHANFTKGKPTFQISCQYWANFTWLANSTLKMRGSQNSGSGWILCGPHMSVCSHWASYPAVAEIPDWSREKSQ